LMQIPNRMPRDSKHAMAFVKQLMRERRAEPSAVASD